MTHPLSSITFQDNVLFADAPIEGEWIYLSETARKHDPKIRYKDQFGLGAVLFE